MEDFFNALKKTSFSRKAMVSDNKLGRGEIGVRLTETQVPRNTSALTLWEVDDKY